MQDLREEIIHKIMLDDRITQAGHIDNQYNTQIQKQSVKAYQEIVARILKELEK